MFPLVAAEDPWQGQNEFVCKCSGENYIYELQLVKQHQILHGRPELIAINGSEIMSHHVTSLHDIFLTMQGCRSLATPDSICYTIYMPSSAIIPASCDTPVEQSVTCRFNGQLFSMVDVLSKKHQSIQVS